MNVPLLPHAGPIAATPPATPLHAYSLFVLTRSRRSLSINPCMLQKCPTSTIDLYTMTSCISTASNLVAPLLCGLHGHGFCTPTPNTALVSHVRGRCFGIGLFFHLFMCIAQQILFRKRFMDFETDEEILRIIDDAVRSWTTGQYDDFQQKTNGYLK